MHKTKLKLAQSIAKIALFVSMTIICSLFLVIPAHPVPITFQTVVAVSAGILIGKNKALLPCRYIFYGGYLSYSYLFGI